jgi:hypothetical protein
MAETPRTCLSVAKIPLLRPAAASGASFRANQPEKKIAFLSYMGIPRGIIAMA